MRRLVRLGVACAPIVLGAFLPVASSAAAAGRTISFTALVTFSTIEAGPTTSETFTQRLLNTKGKAVGSATLSCTSTATQQTCSATYTLRKSLPKGTISANFTLSKSASGKGNVTGGTGAFASANGTIAVKRVNAKEAKYAITVKLR